MEKKISILGCGWLGLPLAKALMKDGYQVKGSTTSEEKLPILQKEGIEPYLIELSSEDNVSDAPSFFQNEILLINIPPGRKRKNVDTYYPNQISTILKQHPTKKILFISSTSVYPNVNSIVTEDDFPTGEQDVQSLRASGRALVKAENLIHKYSEFATIVRFCGLIGPDRHPGRFLAGKKIDSTGKEPINFIHLSDCISIIKSILNMEVWGKTYNACADRHPEKETFYLRATEKLKATPPQFTSSEKASFKEVNSDKLKRDLNYQFIYPDPTACI